MALVSDFVCLWPLLDIKHEKKLIKSKYSSWIFD